MLASGTRRDRFGYSNLMQYSIETATAALQTSQRRPSTRTGRVPSETGEMRSVQLATHSATMGPVAHGVLPHVAANSKDHEWSRPRRFERGWHGPIVHSGPPAPVLISTASARCQSRLREEALHSHGEVLSCSMYTCMPAQVRCPEGAIQAWRSFVQCC